MTDELKPLTNTDLATLAEYVKSWNGTRAWMATHPKSSYNAARVSASEWLTKPNIKAAIQDKLEQMHMSADEALALLAEHARGDIGEFLDISSVGFSLDLEEAQKKGITRLIKKIEQKVVTINGKQEDKEIITTRIELHDPQAAARDVLKIHGKFTEHVDVTSGGKPLTWKDFINDPNAKSSSE